MRKVYFEQRVTAARGTASQAADLMRHLHTRQYLGRTVIVCEQPIAMLSAARKQWLKLSRAMQQQRSGTLNVDKILKYTHSITRMQRMQFTGKDPYEWSNADVYCLRPDDAIFLPDECFTVYVTVPITESVAKKIAAQLPAGALIVDYDPTGPWQNLGLDPKTAIEQAVIDKWDQIEAFFVKYHIESANLFAGNLQNIQAMDDALDTLLGVSKAFMGLADDFHRTLALARPLRVTKALRMKYDSLSLLAHRVQALSPGEYTQRFLETYNEDDGMFLYDSARQNRSFIAAEDLAEIIERHRKAGRFNLAAAYNREREQVLANENENSSWTTKSDASYDLWSI